MMEDLIEVQPARTFVRLTEVAPGGTGRFSVIVHRPNGLTRRVATSLSRSQAETACAAINETLGEWFDDQ